MRRPVGGPVSALVVGLVVLITACGGSSEEADGLVDAIADQIEADAIGTDGLFAREEAECIARSYVTTIGVETMGELGLDEASVRGGAGPGDAALTDDEIDEIASAMGGCIDMAKVIGESLAYAGLSEGTLDCLGDAFEGDLEAGLMSNTIRYGELLPRDNPTVGLAVAEAIGRCVTPQELERLEAGE